MLPHQFRDNAPCQLGSSYGMRTMPLFPRQHNSPKKKRGMRESVPRQVDRESRGPQGERGLEFSRRKKGQTFFPSLHSLGLYNNNVSCLRTVFGLNLLANSVIQPFTNLPPNMLCDFQKKKPPLNDKQFP